MSNTLVQIDDQKYFVTEEINDRYFVSKYHDEFEIIVAQEDGYINATKMCEIQGKRYSDWTRNSATLKMFQKMREIEVFFANIPKN